MLSFKNKRDLRVVFFLENKFAKQKGWFLDENLNMWDTIKPILTGLFIPLLLVHSRAPTAFQSTISQSGRKKKKTKPNQPLSPCFSLVPGKEKLHQTLTKSYHETHPSKGRQVNNSLGRELTGKVRLFVRSNGAIYSSSWATTTPQSCWR